MKRGDEPGNLQISIATTINNRVALDEQSLSIARGLAPFTDLSVVLWSLLVLFESIFMVNFHSVCKCGGSRWVSCGRLCFG